MVVTTATILVVPVVVLYVLPSIVFNNFKDSRSPTSPDAPVLGDDITVSAGLARVSASVDAILSRDVTSVLIRVRGSCTAYATSNGRVVGPCRDSPGFGTGLFINRCYTTGGRSYAAVSVASVRGVVHDNGSGLCSCAGGRRSHAIRAMAAAIAMSTTANRRVAARAMAASMRG